MNSAFLLVTLLFAGCFFEEEPPENEGDPEESEKECVFPGYVKLESQNEVDSFAALIDTCDRVSVVYLWIMGEDITSLQGFNDKFSVIKSLQVSNTSLKTLKGLGTIDTITELKLSDNKLLDSMAITITDSVIYEIELRNNLELKHIDELESLKTVFYFRLAGSYISSIDGLKNLERLASSMTFTSLPSLTSLSGLESLHTRFTANNYTPDPYFDPPVINLIGNPGLIDFCAISHLIGNEDFQINISDNAYNPTTQDFLEGRCKVEQK